MSFSQTSSPSFLTPRPGSAPHTGFLAVLWKHDVTPASGTVPSLFPIPSTHFPEGFKAHFLKSLKSLLKCHLLSMALPHLTTFSGFLCVLVFGLLLLHASSICIYFLFICSHSNKNYRGTKILFSSMPRRVPGARRYLINFTELDQIKYAELYWLNFTYLKVPNIIFTSPHVAQDRWKCDPILLPVCGLTLG